MHGVITLLNTEQNEAILSLWQLLEEQCGLQGVKMTPLPHFSWQIAQDYPVEQVKLLLGELTSSAKPFTARTTGLGLFTGTSPVLYIPLVKDNGLLAFHKMIWERVSPVATGVNPYYAPDQWIPHITLAHGDVSNDRLACAIRQLAAVQFNWEFQVDNLGLVYQQDGQAGWLDFRFDFKG